jgi:hypothetical protein
MKRFKPTATLLSTALAVVLASVALLQSALAASPATSRISVSWNDPAELTEVKDTVTRRTDNALSWLKDLKKYLVRRAEMRLPEGNHLDVRFNDIKLAGSYEPWRGPAMDNVRIVKDVYPPRIDLSFTLTDASGQVLERGDRKLRDPAFMQRGLANDSDPLRYEKRMLDDWLAREFGQRRAEISRSR